MSQTSSLTAGYLSARSLERRLCWRGVSAGHCLAPRDKRSSSSNTLYAQCLSPLFFFPQIVPRAFFPRFMLGSPPFKNSVAMDCISKVPLQVASLEPKLHFSRETMFYPYWLPSEVNPEMPTYLPYVTAQPPRGLLVLEPLKFSPLPQADLLGLSKYFVFSFTSPFHLFLSSLQKTTHKSANS